MAYNRYDDIKKHCDTIWEYNSETDKIFIFKDNLYPEMENNCYSADELERFYSKLLFKSDSELWARYLSRTALKNFPKSEKASVEFEIRLVSEKAEFDWYKIKIERKDDITLTISDKNIYNDIMSISHIKAVKNIFDSIIFIDVKQGNYLVAGTSDNKRRADNASYEKMIENFFVTYADESEADKLIGATKIETVVKELENNEKYSIYADLNIGGKHAYKKMIFSYLDSKKTFLMLTRVDVSDLVDDYENKLKRYKKENYRDEITGAYNRKYMERKINRLRIPAGVALIDIDDFKLCNDIYGHNCGDEVLVMVADAIKRNISAADTLIRYGGDEFVVVMPGVTEDEFETKLACIRESIYGGAVIGYPEVQVSVSIGGTIAGGETLKEAVLKADGFMYNAKSRKNTVVTDNTSETVCKGENTVLGKKEIRQQILIVDDSEKERKALSEMLGNDFGILTAKNGRECMELLRRGGENISLVLLDTVMPVMDGTEVLTFMNSSRMLDNIPVVMISGEGENEYVRWAYGMGIADYISRPFDAAVVYRRVFNTIKLYSKQRRLVSIIAKQTKENEKNNRMMVDIFSNLVELRNGEDGTHVVHVNIITGMLLERLMQKTDKYNLSWKERSLIITASSLHDIGKMGIDERILTKKEKLTEEEFEIVKRHTVIGAKMLEDMTMYKDEALVKTAVEICRHHHERYDGNGYPDKLKGDEIPISAQVVALADAYDALISKRSYKNVFSHDEAVSMILKGECGCFNPVLLECFTDIGDNIRKAMIKE